MSRVYEGPLDNSVTASWIIRESDDGHQRPLTKPHYIESVVAGDGVTYCGRRLRDKPGSVFRVVDPYAFGDACGNCPFVSGPDDEGLD
jgi:hypothetical protein